MVEKQKEKSDSKKAKAKLEHILIPEHQKITEEEKQELFDYHNISIKDLPKILINDPAIKHLGVKENDVVRIIRNSSTAGKSTFYRGVVSE